VVKIVKSQGCGKMDPRRVVEVSEYGGGKSEIWMTEEVG